MIGRTDAQQVLLEMQEAREAVASQNFAHRGKLQQELKTQLWRRITRLESVAGSSCLDAYLAQPEHEGIAYMLPADFSSFSTAGVQVLRGQPRLSSL